MIGQGVQLYSPCWQTVFSASPWPSHLCRYHVVCTGVTTPHLLRLYKVLMNCVSESDSLGCLGVVAFSTASPNCQIPKCLQDSWAFSSIITRFSHKETLESWWVKIHWSYIEMRCWERVGSKSTSPCVAFCSGRHSHQWICLGILKECLVLDILCGK